MPKKAEYDINKVKNAFALFDDLDDGKIPVKSLGPLLRALGCNPTDAQVTKVSDGAPGDTRITMDQFLPIFEGVLKKPEEGTFGEFIEGLKTFDKEGNGLINSGEFRNMLMNVGERLTAQDLEEIMEGIELKEDSDGKINYKEFCKAVMLDAPPFYAPSSE